MKTRPSIPRLRKLRKQIRYDVMSTLGIAGELVSISAKEALVQYIVDFVERPGDFEPGIHDPEAGALNENEVLRDDEHRLRRRRSAENLCQPFIGHRLDGELLRRFCLVLAGRIDELRSGSITTTGWVGDLPVETLLYINDIHRIPGKGRRYAVEFEAHTGPPAGWRWWTTISGGMLQELIRDIGAPKYKQYRDEDVSGMWFIAEMVCTGGQIRFLDRGVVASQIENNKALAKARTSPCTGAFKALKGKPCMPCPLSRKECPISRYAVGWSLEKQCVQKHTGLFRKADDEYCFLCCLKGNFIKESYGGHQNNV